MPDLVVLLEELTCIRIPSYWSRKVLPVSGRLVFYQLTWDDMDYLIEILKKASHNSFRLSLQQNTIAVQLDCDPDKRQEIWMTAQIWKGYFQATLTLLENPRE